MKKLVMRLSVLTNLARRITGSLLPLLLLSGLSFGQLTTYTLNSAPDTPVTGSNTSAYEAYALPSTLMTGSTVDLIWNVIDTGSATSGCPNITSANWTAFDNSLSTFITDGSSTGKFINFIVMPVTEPGPSGGSNRFTPAYVFTQAWANNLADGGCSGLGSGVVLKWGKNEPVLPGNYIFVNSHYWQETNQPWSSSSQFVGTCTTNLTAEPAFLGTVSSYTDNNCTWTNVGTNAPAQDACFTAGSTAYPGDGVILSDNGGTNGCFNVNNLPGTSTLTNLETGFLVSYETPMKTAYKNFIQQVISHYQNSATRPTGLKLGYIRFGLSQGGETVPLTSGIPWPYFKNLSGEGPTSGASIVYLSYDYEMMLFQNTNNQQNGTNAPINMQADLNTWNNVTDYPDQESLYATENYIGIGTNGLQVNDVTNINLNGCSSPSTSTYPISGDWCYNFQTYCSQKMGPTHTGNYPICSLQTLHLSTPGDTASGDTGPLSAEGTFQGLLPTAFKYGANNLEIYTCDILYTVMYAFPTTNYPGSSDCGTDGNLADSNYEVDYQNAFAIYLNSLEPGIYSPAPGANIQSDSSATLTWNAYSGAASYTLEVGSAQGGASYHSPLGVTGLTKTVTFTTDPGSGDPVWVRWRAVNSTGGVLLQVDYHFVAP